MRISQFEDPIDTVLDLVKHNITIFTHQIYYDNHRDFYLRSNTSEWDHVAKTLVPADSSCRSKYETEICAEKPGTWQYFVKNNLHGSKTHAIIKGYLSAIIDLEVMPEKKNWWRSNKLEYFSNPFGGLITSRNWILNEVKFLLQADSWY